MERWGPFCKRTAVATAAVLGLAGVAGCQETEADGAALLPEPTPVQAVPLPQDLPADYVPGGVYGAEARARCLGLGGREMLDGNGLTFCSLGARTGAVEICAEGRIASVHSNETGRRILFVSTGDFAELATDQLTEGATLCGLASDLL
jgi:hypothetical protein